MITNKFPLRIAVIIWLLVIYFGSTYESKNTFNMDFPCYTCSSN